MGTTCIFSLEMSIPGATMPTAGVSMVSVKPTHRRRGILTAIMRRQLQDVADRGEAVAALWASESAIYGRFGYGLASQAMNLSVERQRATLAHDITSSGCVRFVDEAEALEKWPACLDRWRVTRPGAITRSAGRWEFGLERSRKKPGSERRFLAQYEEDGMVRGYVRYEWGGVFNSWLPNAKLKVNELVAETPQAYAALWKLVLNTDLVGTIEAPLRPADEPLYHMLADSRHLQRSLMDALWIRLLDIPKALSARRYAADGAVTLTVHDDFRPEQGGKYRLEVRDGEGHCQRTTGPGDLELHVRDLGAVYLGSTSLTELAQAGRVCGAPETVTRADRLFAWPVPAWCQEVFAEVLGAEYRVGSAGGMSYGRLSSAGTSRAASFRRGPARHRGCCRRVTQPPSRAWNSRSSSRWP
ncbi:MAG: GNAT family N-acetyltransferase [Dehalococcoidia bacterium]|nr:GNAT family N-acetyltransferase [Dehalococcoidia bacterium]